MIIRIKIGHCKLLGVTTGNKYIIARLLYYACFRYEFMSRSSTILNGEGPLVLVRYSHEQTGISLIRYAIKSSLEILNPVLLITFLHSPTTFIEQPEAQNGLHLVDYSGTVPGYLETKSMENICGTILDRVISSR